MAHCSPVEGLCMEEEGWGGLASGFSEDSPWKMPLVIHSGHITDTDHLRQMQFGGEGPILVCIFKEWKIL